MAERPEQEGAPVGAAWAAVEQGAVDHEHGYHLVGGGQPGQQDPRVVGHPEVLRNHTTARLGMATALLCRAAGGSWRAGADCGPAGVTTPDPPAVGPHSGG
jgi:hypothetical protein